ncbi:hypothetical protein ALO54_102724 [Pseudomonas syringae pv. philadelphi]|uniref:Uncharacterized protein n=1 Tax=Pseudomonas syringae pv. maculicola TaxID=59511 RepID=A0A3M2XZ13_PSEYM|nr:hypothetical protein ALO54_102724 [Pseudomonas syringae pv. philadelphi]RML69013.1 hypothetical protein APX70_101102 [Pseudomonas syringae pv. maculicola]
MMHAYRAPGRRAEAWLQAVRAMPLTYPKTVNTLMLYRYVSDQSLQSQ